MKSYVERYGTDRYTAYEDLKAVGFPLTEADERWAVRPVPVPRTKQRADPPWEWHFDGYQVMVVIGHTPGGFPYGPTETAEDHVINCALGPRSDRKQRGTFGHTSATLWRRAARGCG